MAEGLLERHLRRYLRNDAHVLAPKLCESLRQMPNQMTRRVLILLLFLIVLAAVIWKARSEGDRSRAEVARLATELSSRPLSETEVRQVLRKSQYGRLSLREFPHEWIVGSPSEFGATNWVIYIQWQNRLTRSIQVRTPDSAERRPESAPPDKVFD